MKKSKSSSIKTKILLGMIATTVISVVAVGGASVYLNYSGTLDALNISMAEIAQAASTSVAHELNVYKTAAFETGSIKELCSASTSVEVKQEILAQKIADYGFVSGDILDENGKSIFNAADYSGYEFYTRSISGNKYISEPIINEDKSGLTIYVSAPIWENGVPGSKAVGVVTFVTKETLLNDIVTSFSVGKNGGAYLLSKDGITIAHKNISGVLNKENTQEDAKSDTQLNALAALEHQMTLGERGCGQYSYGGVNKFLAYAPIPDTDGWSIGINAPLSDFLGSTYSGVYLTIAIILVALIVCIFSALFLAKHICKPLTACTDRLKLLAAGDLHSPAPELKTSDETGELAIATGQIIVNLNDIIGDIQKVLGAMAQGDLTLGTTAKFPGDLKEISISISEILTSLNNTMLRISHSSAEVATGAEQVSDSAQALSQGATEQASAVEELSATINVISQELNSTCENARLARDISAETGESVSASNEQMRQMIEAMKEIAKTAGEIGKIIKAIDDIAFQTNILALNAAVEAARAGESGKGFAVVADEVRNLAGKSAAASQNTTALIESAISAVNRGAAIADETAQSLQVVVNQTKDVVDRIQNIASASETQAAEVTQVSQGIQQISDVVQTNSATAQESAATSEELSGQSLILKDLLNKFTLIDEERAASNEQTEVDDD